MAHAREKGQVAAVRRFNRFYTRLLGLLDEKLLASPVSLTEARILWELQRNPRCRAEDLLLLLSVDRGYMSRLLSRLERAGFLLRSAHARDGRMRLLALTPKGRSFLGRLEEQASAQVAGLLGPLTASQRKRLVQAMAEVEALLSAGDTRRMIGSPGDPHADS
jgi:DNA-binding MarR family transcriptional regulator